MRQYLYLSVSVFPLSCADENEMRTGDKNVSGQENSASYITS
jgi:hypothetical protein